MHSKGQGGWQACMFCKKKRVSLYNIGLEGDIIVFCTYVRNSLDINR
jgi:hypothetical protein